jgi:AcrR family transcriptional regulator
MRRAASLPERPGRGGGVRHNEGAMTMMRSSRDPEDRRARRQKPDDVEHGAHDAGHRHHEHVHAEHVHAEHGEHRRAPRRPGRPRSEAADKAIVEAVLDLLSEGVPYGVLSVEQIATRAGVGKATLYRRWANKESLVVYAMAALFQECPMPDFTDGTPIRGRLVEALHVIATSLLSERSGLLFSAVMAEGIRHPELVRKYQETAIEPRRDVMRAILREAVGAGELRADIDIERSLRMIVAPLVMTLKTEHLGEVMSPAVIGPFIEGLVDDLLQGLAPR